MSSVEGLPVIQYFADISGKSLDDGFVYIGTSGLDPVANPISVFWDAALTIPAPNPIRTRNGHPDRSGVPSRFFVDTDSYSFAVKNKNGTTVYTALDSLSATDIERRLRNSTDPAKGAGIVGYTLDSDADDIDVRLRLRGYVTGEDFGLVGDATTTDGTTGTDNTANMTRAINYINSRRCQLRVSADRRSGKIGYLMGNLPEITGGGAVIVGAGENCTYFVSKTTLSQSFFRLKANGAGVRDLGIFCNDPTRRALETTGVTTSSEGYQPNIHNVLISGGLYGLDNLNGLEMRVLHTHVVDTQEYGIHIARPDAILINASTDRSGTDGVRVENHVFNSFHAHPIKSGRHGFRITSATASIMVGDHADTSAYHGIDLDTNSGVRIIAPFSFKSGDNLSNIDARNYRLVNNTDCVIVAPLSNQDTNCDFSYYGSGNADCLLIAPIDRGTKNSSLDEGMQVALAKGRMERYNSLSVPRQRQLPTIVNAGTGTFAVSEPAAYTRSFNSMMYRGDLIVRLATQNRIIIGEFAIATGGDTTFPAAIPITWKLQGSSPDVSASVTLTATYSSTGATITVHNATGESINVGMSVQQVVSAKSV